MTISRAFVLSLVCCGIVAAGDVDLAVKPMDRIPAGTRFQLEPPANWSNIISFVEGRLGSGDTDAVSETVAYYAKLFNLVMLANVEQGTDKKYFLDKVAIGFSMVIDGQNTIVTSDTHKRLHSGLSFIGGSVLSGNEEALADVVQVGRMRTNMIIDAPAIILRDGQHKKMICRYAIWVSQANGGIGTVCWLLEDRGEQTDYAVVEDTFQYLPVNMREDRVLNVKKDRFTLGIPAKDAFAVLQIPQGTAFQVTDEMRANAGARHLTEKRYKDIWSSMSRAMRQKPIARTAKAK